MKWYNKNNIKRLVFEDDIYNLEENFTEEDNQNGKDR